jgi:large subunit ribosomal protein L25
MKSIELKVSLRKTTGKKDAKKLRKNNQVPCVLYGGKENMHFFAEERSFKDLIYTHHVYIVNLDIEGKKHKAILKEIQFHPVSDRIDHIDFVEVASDKPVVIDLPVEITGSSVGIRAGGKLRQRKRYVKVKGLIEHLPDSLVIDISDLEIGQSVLAGDLKYPHVEILELMRSLVVGVVSSRIAKGMEEGAEAAAPAEGAPAAAAPAAAEAAAPVETKKK